MPRRRIQLDALSPPPASQVDVAFEGIVYALLLFMPAAFGAVEAWSELIVSAGVAAAVLAAAFRSVQTGSWRPPSRAAWIALIGVALLPTYALWQSIPLPQSVVSTIAPATAEAYAEQLADVAAPPAEIALSLNRGATARRARLLAVAAALFAIAATLRSEPAVKRMLAAMFLVGVAEGVVALLHIVTGATQIYGAYGSPGGRVTSGSFVNYSNFSQFMNLAIGAGAALWTMQLARNSRNGDAGVSLTTVQNELRRHGWLVAGLVLTAIAVLTSLSRNGAISLAAATVAAGSLMWRRGALSWRGWALAVIPVAVFGVLTLTALDVVYERMATLRDGEQALGRWEMTLGALRAWQAFPLWGVGFDAHAVVFPLFDSAVSASIAEHADNDWAQWLEETGLVGAALAAVLLAALGTIAWRLMFRGRRSSSHATFGLALGLIAVGIHSATDFGQRLPAVFAMTALSCGLLVALERLERRRNGEGATDEMFTELPWPRALRCSGPLLAALALAATGVVWGAYRAYVAERWWWAATGFESRIAAAEDIVAPEQYADLLAAAENAVAWAPDNAEYRFWLNAYRWQALQGAFAAEEDEAVDPEAVVAARQIADDLAAGRALAPTYGPPVALEGELRLFVLGEERGADLIRRAVRLAPYDPTAALVAGQLAIRDGQIDEARRQLDRAVKLAPGSYPDVARAYLLDFNQPDWVRALAGDDPGRLAAAARIAEEEPSLAEIAAALGTEAEAALRARVAADRAAAGELAALAALDAARGDFAEAEQLYRRALGLEYGQIGWRLELARLLASQERYDDAVREAKIILRLRPKHPQAERLVGEWSVKVPPVPETIFTPTQPSHDDL